MAVIPLEEHLRFKTESQAALIPALINRKYCQKILGENLS